MAPPDSTVDLIQVTIVSEGATIIVMCGLYFSTYRMNESSLSTDMILIDQALGKCY